MRYKNTTNCKPIYYKIMKNIAQKTLAQFKNYSYPCNDKFRPTMTYIKNISTTNETSLC